MNKALRFLLIEDSESDALLLERQLRRGGFERASFVRADTTAALDAALRENGWDVVICDYRLPGFNGLAALKQIQAGGRDVPFILVSGVIGEEQAVEAMKAGAHDFILKDKLSRLVPAVERELREAEVRRQRRLAVEELQQAKTEWERTFDSVPDLIAILDDKHQIRRANRAMADRLKLSPGQCVGLHCAKAVHGSDHPISDCPHSRTLADGKEHVAELEVPRLGGHFLVSTTPLLDAQNRMIGAVHVGRDITERKRAETELRENQERLLLAQQAGHVGVFDVNFQTGRCVWTNELKALFGLPPTYEETPDSWSTLVHPDDRELMTIRLRHAIQTHAQELEQRYRIRRPEGEVRWFEDRALITYDDAGALQRVVGTTTDITAYKQAQEQLLISDKRLRHSAIVGVMMLAGAIFVTESLEMIALSFLHSLSIWQSVLLDSSALLLLASPVLYYSVFRPIAQLLRERERAQEDLRRANEHLELRVQERTASLEAANQKLQVEIAERQQAQAALTEAHRQKEEALARLDALFECAPLGLGFWDTDLHSLRINPALAKMNALTADTPRGWTPDQLLPESATVPEVLADCRQVVATGQPLLNVEVSGKTAGHPDETRWWVGNWFPVRVQERVIGLGATLLDITERRRAQDALRQANDVLEQQVQERTAELVGMNVALRSEMAERRSLEARILEVSEREQRRIGQDLHDSLCQQLTGINYLCTVAEQRLAQVAPAETAALTRINELLCDTMDQARSLARGLHPVEDEANGLVVALTGLAKSFRSVFRISARFVCSQPVLMEDNTVATHLYRIAQEAMSNAVRHGKASQIVLRLSETPQALRLAVRDNGCGFPADAAQPKGLGLLTMQFRARTIGAELAIQRGEQKGTVLTLTLSKKTNPHSEVAHE